MIDVLTFSLLGIGTGAVVALLGLGIVTIYKGSGVLNFAQGAVAMYAAYVFVVLREDRGLNVVVAILLSLVVAGLLGALIYFVVIRPLQNAPVLARVVGTLGVLLFLQAVAFWQFGGTIRSVAPIIELGSIEIFGVRIGQDRLLLGAIAVLLCAALWAVYRFTLFGLATRAASETAKGAAVTGYSQARLALINWVIGSVLAGIAGILIAPLTRLSTVSIALLIVPALAAALVGRLENLWMVLVGGLLLGVGQSLTTGFFPEVQGLSDTVPFLVIVILLALRGSSLPLRGELVVSDLPRAPVPRRLPLKLGILTVLVVGALLVLPDRYAAGVTIGLVGAVVVLSLIVVVGYVGQVSLAQLAFAGVGAYVAAYVGTQLGWPFPIPLLVGALVAVPVGVLIGLPALRVRGINLAIVTMGAALVFERMVFNNSWTNSTANKKTPVPELFGFSLDARIHPDRYGFFVLAVLLICLVLVANLRRSPSGRILLAVRADESAAVGCGISLTGAKLKAFAFSAFLAGLAGGLEAYRTTFVNAQDYTVFQSIFFLAIAYIGGIATIGGAAIAVLFIPGNPVSVWLSDTLQFDRLVDVLAAFGLVSTVVTQPDGLANIGANEAEKRRRRKARKERSRAGKEVDVVST